MYLRPPSASQSGSVGPARLLKGLTFSGKIAVAAKRAGLAAACPDAARTATIVLATYLNRCYKLRDSDPRFFMKKNC